MRIDNNSPSAYGIEQLDTSRSRGATPIPSRSLGSGDTAVISDEARRAFAESRAAAQTPAPSLNQKAEDGEQAQTWFADFMKEARGGHTDLGGDDPVEELKKMIEKLQEKLEATAKSDLPEESKRAVMETMQEQINGLQKDMLALTANA